MSPASAEVTLDTAAPSGASVVINGGASWANSSWVTLDLSGHDQNNLEMCVSHKGTASGCAVFEPFRKSKDWQLIQGFEGPRYVYLFLSDPAGNVIDPPARATISLDDRPPAVTKLQINGGAHWTASRVVNLTVEAIDMSGVEAICARPSEIECASDDFVPYKEAMYVDLTAAHGDGRRQVFVWLRDGAGNTIQAPASAEIALDTTPPSNVTVTVDGGARLVSAREVLLNITADDFIGVSEVCIGEGPPASDCTGFDLFEGTHRYSLLPGGDGERTVYVTLRDWAGNTMARPASVSVVLDMNPPSDASVTINAGAAATSSREVVLGLSASDAGGVSEVCVSESLTATSSSCQPWEPYEAAKRFTLSEVKGPKSVVAFFKDSLGRATESPAVADIVYDTSPPLMALRGGAAVNATAGRNSVTLSWAPSLSSDGPAGSGVGGYVVVFRAGGAWATGPRPHCNPYEPAISIGATVPAERNGTEGGNGTAAGAQMTGLAVVGGLRPGTRYRFRLCAYDLAGNRARGFLVKLKTLR